MRLRPGCSSATKAQSVALKGYTSHRRYRATKYLLRGHIWVDAEDFAITKVEGRPAKSPSFWIRSSRVVYRFKKFGSYWFPESTFSEADVRIFGDTRLEIVYQDYKVAE